MFIGIRLSQETTSSAIVLIHGLFPVAVTSVCFNNAVGVANISIIVDNQMTASTLRGNNYLPAYGRLHGNRGKGWCAQSCCEGYDWLQVDLGKTHQVCGFATQGHIVNAGMVTDLKLSFSIDGGAWTPYVDEVGSEMVRISRIQTCNL